MWNAHRAALYLPWWPPLQSLGRLGTSTHSRDTYLHTHTHTRISQCTSILMRALLLTTWILHPLTIMLIYSLPYAQFENQIYNPTIFLKSITLNVRTDINFHKRPRYESLKTPTAFHKRPQHTNKQVCLTGSVWMCLCKWLQQPTVQSHQCQKTVSIPAHPQ